jgi:hypothetical protein
VVRPACLTKYAEVANRARVSKLSRARNSLGRKYLHLSEWQLTGPPVIRAKLLFDDLRAVYGISAGTGASSSAEVRKSVETTERAFVVLLDFCSPKAIG